MKSIKEFFEKKKLAHKFAKAGPGAKLTGQDGKPLSEGHKLGSGQPSNQSGPQSGGLPSPSPASSSSSSKSSVKDNMAKAAAAEAAEKRIQALKLQNQRATVKMSSYKSYPTAEEHPSSESLPKEEGEVAMSIRPEEDAGPEDEDDLHSFNCPSLDLLDHLPLKELKQRIEEKIRSDFKEEPVIMGSLLIRNCNPKDKAKMCVSTLEIILNNLKTDDLEKWEKFKKVKKAKIEQRILSITGGAEFLTGAGFVLENDGEWFVYEGPKDSVDEKVDYYLDILKSSDVCPIMLNRRTNVVDLSTLATPNIDYDDKVFELTRDELTREQKARKEQIDREQTLMTKAMRAKFEPAKMVTKYARLRYKSLSMRMIEATFRTDETLHDYISWLKTHEGLGDIENYDIVCGTEIIPPEQWSKTFVQLGFYPRATFHQRAKKSEG